MFILLVWRDMNPSLSSNPTRLSCDCSLTKCIQLISDNADSRFGVGPVDPNRLILGRSSGVAIVGTDFLFSAIFFLGLGFGFGTGEGGGATNHSGSCSCSGDLRVRRSSAITGSGCGSGGSGASSRPGVNMGGGDVSEKAGKIDCAAVLSIRRTARTGVYDIGEPKPPPNISLSDTQTA